MGGNGGEFRKSYHGYPRGMAQLIDSPTAFHIQPMQIDTKNRHYNGTDFKADLLPKASLAPPNASYSGLLECPCTDRIVKKIEMTYTTQSSGSCPVSITNATECFEAADKVADSKVDTNVIVTTTKLPGSCSVIHHSNGTVIAYYNTQDSGVQCGGGQQFTGSITTEDALTTTTLLLDNRVQGGKVTITMTGPNGKWFSVGIGSDHFAMSDKPYTIVVDGTGNVSERKLGDHDSGSVLPSSLTVISNSVKDGVREVVMTRAFAGKTPDHYSFETKTSSIPMISASGLGSTFAYHGPKQRTGGRLSLSVLDSPTCICNGGMKGSIQGIPFNKNCLPEPAGDLVEQGNPTCWVDTYVGGQQCCHHGTVLLDKNQEQPEGLLNYQLKFRFYIQPYTEATRTTPASHRNLLRMYYQTEAWSRECDIPKDPNCWGNTTGYDGINLIYTAGHCHAPSCISISMELYNADTGMLLCAHNPVYGQSHQVFDELGYITIPPCLWGEEEEALIKPTFLPFHANLTSIKRNNNTDGHYGEIASWQMRGVLVK